MTFSEFKFGDNMLDGMLPVRWMHRIELTSTDCQVTMLNARRDVDFLKHR